MANLTVYEHFEMPDQNSDLHWQSDVETTIASTATLKLRDETQYVVVCADADCRIGFNKAALASGMPILSAVPNPFRLNPGSNRTLQFL